MPSFYKERDSWVCAYTVQGVDGKHVRKKKRGFALERDAKRWYNKIAGGLDDGTFAKTERITVAQWLRRWHEVYCAALAPSTRRAYEISIEKHLIPRLGVKLKLSEVRPDIVQALCNDLCAARRTLKCDSSPRAYSPGQVRQVMMCLSAALNRAAFDGLITRNPCKRVKLPELPRPERAYCTAEQIKAVLLALAGTPYYMPALLCTMLGLRRGEALGLRWNAVDLKEKTVRIAEQVISQKGGVAQRDLKTKASARTLFLPDALVEALKQQRKAQKVAKVKHGEHYRDEGFVCSTRMGGVQHPDDISRGISKAMNTIAPGRTLHDLRHSYATLLRQSGIAIEVISALLGHTNVSTTYAYYVGDDEKARKQAADQIQTIIK